MDKVCDIQESKRKQCRTGDCYYITIEKSTDNNETYKNDENEEVRIENEVPLVENAHTHETFPSGNTEGEIQLCTTEAHNQVFSEKKKSLVRRKGFRSLKQPDEIHRERRANSFDNIMGKSGGKPTNTRQLELERSHSLPMTVNASIIDTLGKVVSNAACSEDDFNNFIMRRKFEDDEQNRRNAVRIVDKPPAKIFKRRTDSFDEIMGQQDNEDDSGEYECIDGISVLSILSGEKKEKFSGDDDATDDDGSDNYETIDIEWENNRLAKNSRDSSISSTKSFGSVSSKKSVESNTDMMWHPCDAIIESCHNEDGDDYLVPVDYLQRNNYTIDNEPLYHTLQPGEQGNYSKNKVNNNGSNFNDYFCKQLEHVEDYNENSRDESIYCSIIPQNDIYQTLSSVIDDSSQYIDNVNADISQDLKNSYNHNITVDFTNNLNGYTVVTNDQGDDKENPYAYVTRPKQRGYEDGCEVYTDGEKLKSNSDESIIEADPIYYIVDTHSDMQNRKVSTENYWTNNGSGNSREIPLNDYFGKCFHHSISSLTHFMLLINGILMQYNGHQFSVFPFRAFCVFNFLSVTMDR